VSLTSSHIRLRAGVASRGFWAAVVLVLVVILPVSIAAAAFVSATSSASNSIGADTLDPPTGLGVTRNGTNNDLTWTPTVDTYADHYDVYRSTSSGSGFSLLTTVAGQATASYSDPVGASSSPTFESSTTDTTFGSSSTLGTPAGTAEDDLLLAVFGGENCSGTKPTITGWTKRVDMSNATTALWVYERVATSSEPGSHTFSFGQSCWYTASMLRYSGVDTTTPTEDWTAFTGSSPPVNSPSSTSTEANSVVLRLLAIHDRFVTSAPSGHTMRTNQQAAASDSSATADQDLPSAGASGTATWSVSGNGSWYTVSTIIRPDSQLYYYRLRSGIGSWESADSNEASG
jgi:hypothetical protein